MEGELDELRALVPYHWEGWPPDEYDQGLPVVEVRQDQLLALLEEVASHRRPPGEELRALAEKHLGPYENGITGSKSGYLHEFPTNAVFFNAWIEDGSCAWPPLWHGDIDLTLREDDLVRLAIESRRTLYLIRQHDGFIGADEEWCREHAVVIVGPDGALAIGDYRYHRAPDQRIRRVRAWGEEGDDE